MPNPIRASPFRMKAGMIVCSGRLWPPTVLIRPGSTVKRLPRFCSAKPVPRGTIPEPKHEVEKPEDVESLFYHAALMKRLIGEDN